MTATEGVVVLIGSVLFAVFFIARDQLRHGRRTRAPTDLIPPSRKRGGRSFGAALSEVAIVRTPTSSAGLAADQAMSRSPIGGSPVPGLAAALWCSRYALRGL